MTKVRDKPNQSIEDALKNLAPPSTNLSDIAYLLAIKNMQTISHDTETFLRNNHLLYTSTLSAAMKKLIAGDNTNEVEVLLEKLGTLLDNNKQYHADMNSASVKMLTDIQSLTTLD